MNFLTKQIISRDPGRIVIFDSPPLLLTTESHSLAQTMGQVVLVVHAGHAEQQDVLEALSHLPEGVAISAVLNQNVSRNRGAYYGYYGSVVEDPSE